MPRQTLDVANAFARALAGHGVASLRYDKRGVGESSGDYLRAGFDQETSDAAAALEALRRVTGIDGRRTTVIGHSVGATIAIRLAAGERHARRRGAPVRREPARACSDAVAVRADRRVDAGPARLFRRWFLGRQDRARRLLLASQR